MVFPHRRKCRKPEEIVHKKYVLSNETFEFGPLLCGRILIYVSSLLKFDRKGISNLLRLGLITCEVKFNAIIFQERHGIVTKKANIQRIWR